MKKYLKRKIYYLAKKIAYSLYEYGTDKEIDFMVELFDEIFGEQATLKDIAENKHIISTNYEKEKENDTRRRKTKKRKL